jgi:gliding motility-associated-like protein
MPVRYRLFLLLFVELLTSPIFGQLDSTHWIPPFHARYDRARHYVYLTTPEVVPFQVTITDGTGNTILDGNGNVLGPVTISNAAPQVVYIGNGENPANGLVTLTTTGELNVALNSKGLRLSAPQLFYANFRARASDQAGSLTAKGKSGLGTQFRVGHVFNEIVPIPNWNRRSNFISMMATEDSTIVTLSGYTNGMGLMSGGGDIYPTGAIQVTLMAGQCYVISTYVDITRPVQNKNGLQGVLVEATKPIAVNCGSWLGAPFTDGLQDIGIDQIVPVDRVGTEYITIRGDGPNDLETPIVVATVDGTDVFINGSGIPLGTLNAGQYIRIPSGSYTPQENLYILATKPVYVYQMLGGANYKQTGGMNFVPPLGCSEGGSVNNIMDIDKIGTTTYEGKLLLLAESGKQVFINGTQVPPALFNPVSGKPGFVTAKVPGLSGNIRVDSDGPLQVGIFGRNDNAGWAAYFSGFDVVNRPEIEITISSYCGDSLFLTNLTNADSVIWHRNGLPITLKTDTILTGVLPGAYFAVALREFCDEILWDTSALITIPETLSYEADILPLTCPGTSSGAFVLQKLAGGYPPFQISFDGGTNYVDTFALDSLDTGTYSFLIRDSLGCIYDRSLFIPLEPNVPLIQLQPSDTLTCLRDSVFLSSTGSSAGLDYIYTWSTNDGTLTSDPNSKNVYVTQPGTYILEIRNITNNCLVMDSIEVVADTIPPDALVKTSSILTCRDSVSHLIVTGVNTNPALFAWSFQGQPIPALPTSDTIAVNQAGMYAVEITNLINGCTNQFFLDVVENKIAPGAFLSTPGSLDCANTGLWLAASTGNPLNAQFSWTGPDGSMVNSNDSKIYIDLPGSYTIRVMDSINGCISEASLVIVQDTVKPLIDAGMDKALTCKDTMLALLGTSQGCTQCLPTWHHALGGIYSGETTWAPLVAEPGHYFLTVLNPVNGCQATDSVLIDRLPSIDSFQVDIVSPTCDMPQGAIHLVQLFGGTPPYSYAYNASNPSVNPFDIDPAPGGNYTLIVSDKYGCTARRDLVMDEFFPLDLDLVLDVTITYGEEYQIIATPSVPEDQLASIYWTPDSTLSCYNCLNPIARPSASEVYTVKVIDMNGCEATAEIRIDVQFEAAVYIPNSFNPDGDGVNDGFTAFGDPDKIKLIRKMQIFDRWGNNVFEVTDIPANQTVFGWDGMFRDRKMDPAVFIYVIEVEFVNNTRVIYKGDVHLIR